MKNDKKRRKFSINEPGEPSVSDLEAQVFKSAVRVSLESNSVHERDESSEAKTETTKSGWILHVVVAILLIACLGTIVLFYADFSAPTEEPGEHPCEPVSETMGDSEIPEKETVPDSEERAKSSAQDSSGRTHSDSDDGARMRSFGCSGSDSFEARSPQIGFSASRDSAEMADSGSLDYEYDDSYNSDINSYYARESAQKARGFFWGGLAALGVSGSLTIPVKMHRDDIMGKLQNQENDPNFIETAKAKLSNMANATIVEIDEFVKVPVRERRGGRRFRYTVYPDRDILFEDLDQYEIHTEGGPRNGGYLQKLDLVSSTFFIVLLALCAAGGLACMGAWLFHCRKFQKQAGTDNCTETVFCCKSCRDRK